MDLSNQPEGLSIQVSDPVRDFEYARNAVTITFGLWNSEHVRLGFQALKHGDRAVAWASIMGKMPMPRDPIRSIRG